jgi:hypothetical protein
MHAFDFILTLFTFVFVCRDLFASRRRQHIVFGRRRLKLIVRRDEQDREALSCSLFAEGSRQGHFFGFGFFTADFLAPFFALLLRSRTLSEFPLPRSVAPVRGKLQAPSSREVRARISGEGCRSCGGGTEQPAAFENYSCSTVETFATRSQRPSRFS